MALKHSTQSQDLSGTSALSGTLGHKHFVSVPMRLARAVLWLCSLLFALFGAASVLAPRFIAATAGIELPTATARIDFAATYGGFELGVAAFLAFCAQSHERVRLGLLATAFCLAGFALTRGIGIVLAKGEVRPILYPVLALELSGVALCLWAARRAVA